MSVIDAVAADSDIQCYEKCQAIPNDECVAFAYTPTDSQPCDLYRGGPYTTGSGASGSSCYLMPIGIFHLI